MCCPLTCFAACFVCIIGAAGSIRIVLARSPFIVMFGGWRYWRSSFSRWRTRRQSIELCRRGHLAYNSPHPTSPPTPGTIPQHFFLRFKSQNDIQYNRIEFYNLAIPFIYILIHRKNNTNRTKTSYDHPTSPILNTQCELKGISSLTIVVPDLDPYILFQFMSCHGRREADKGFGNNLTR